MIDDTKVFLADDADGDTMTLRPRISTLVLVAAWIGTLVLYVLVH